MSVEYVNIKWNLWKLAKFRRSNALYTSPLLKPRLNITLVERKLVVKLDKEGTVHGIAVAGLKEVWDLNGKIRKTLEIYDFISEWIDEIDNGIDE